MEDARTEAREPEAEESIILRDVWQDGGDLIARFDQDGIRGALYLITPEADILAMVKVYNVAEWSDVREDEVRLWWEGSRCWVSVRGRRRYIDVQVDELHMAQAAA
jgi:hypothetical protein